MPKVSVLVPCCNVEKYVEECLLSIKSQTLSDIEVICINDGSTDSTLDKIRKCTEGDSRFVVIDKPNSGYGDSMNMGLNLASGEYIGIVESDDFIEPNMFEILYTKAKEFSLDVSRACYYSFFEGENKPETWPQIPKNHVFCPKEDTKIFLKEPSIWSAIYKTDWLRASGIKFLPTPGASFQDTSFAFKTRLMSERHMVLDECLLHYRLHGGNSVKNNKNVFAVCDEYAECYRFARDKGLFDVVRDIIPEMQYGTYKWNYLRLDEESANRFYWRWVEEWRVLRKAGFMPPKSWSSSRRMYFNLITIFPKIFEYYLKGKCKV